MERKIGLETSSIIPLLELTPRTFPLQCEIKKAMRENVKFVTDKYSVIEAKQQIIKSYESALRSLDKTKDIADRRRIQNKAELAIIFIKTLAENWYGREETLRWSDITLGVSANGDEFFVELRDKIDKRKEDYLRILREDSDTLSINASQMKSYWVSPEFEENLRVEVRIIENKMSLKEFFDMLQPTINKLYREKITINDIVDLYHLFSLHYDGGIREIWSCNQQFVKKHEKYLKNLDNELGVLFKHTRIKRIK